MEDPINAWSYASLPEIDHDGEIRRDPQITAAIAQAGIAAIEREIAVWRVVIAIAVVGFCVAAFLIVRQLGYEVQG
jgi:hypothetical protein